MTTVAQIFDPGHLPRDDLFALGKARRADVKRRSHGVWSVNTGERDVVGILRAQDEIRVPELVPIRYGRMLESPFNFFRGSAAVMAADLSTTPDIGVNVQACGDAHALNFGMYASPERRIVFDVNDFDETLPAPWEWDLKRMAASIVLEVRHVGWSESTAEEAVATAIRRYREVLESLLDSTSLEIGYKRMDETRFLELYGSSRQRKNLRKAVKKATTRTHDQAVDKWVEHVDGRPRFVSDPPVIVRLGDREVEEFRIALGEYRDTLRHDRRHAVRQYRFLDAARKVVGVGSVGLRAYIVLLEGRDEDDLIVLQVKEATSSVLSPYHGSSGYSRHGERVVRGQRLMQAVSDPFLGWAPVTDRDFYIRQMRDHKGQWETPGHKGDYRIAAALTGGTLARAHARAVDPEVMRGYIGKGSSFVKAITRFARAYADQAEADCELVDRAARRGDIPVLRGV